MKKMQIDPILKLKKTFILLALFPCLLLVGCNKGHKPQHKPQGPPPQIYQHFLRLPAEEFLTLNETDLRKIPQRMLDRKIKTINPEQMEEIIVKKFKFKKFSQLAPTIRGKIPQETYVKKLKKIRRVGYKKGLKKAKGQKPAKNPNSVDAVVDGIDKFVDSGAKILDGGTKLFEKLAGASR